MDDVSGFDQETAHFDRLIERTEAQRAVMDRETARIDGERRRKKALDVAHSAVGDRSQTTRREESFSHPVAQDAFVVPPRPNGLHDPHHRLARPAHLLELIVEIVALRPRIDALARNDGRAAVELARKCNAHRRLDRRGQGADRPSHVILVGRRRIDVADGVREQGSVKIAQFLELR